MNDYCISRECFTYFLFLKNDSLFVLHNRTYMNHLLMVLINSDKMTICLSTDRFLRGLWKSVHFFIFKIILGNSLRVQWIGFSSFTAASMDLIHGQGIKIS